VAGLHQCGVLSDEGVRREGRQNWDPTPKLGKNHVVGCVVTVAGNHGRTPPMTSTGFHEGELAIQRRAGVESDATRLEGMLAPTILSGGAAKFLSMQTFAALTGRDDDGRLWVAPLSGGVGFLRGNGDTLYVSTTPRAGDPLHRMPIDQPVGLIAIDFASRRRLRVNGTLTAREEGLTLHVDQAYGNCPQYIHRRAVDVAALAEAGDLRRGSTLSAADEAVIAGADTFFLGTTHPTRGSDASHRGGPSGFVQIDSPTELWWPDYAGNNMFNSFGNLAVDDEAGLLFIDFATGATVQLSGTAQVRFTDPGAPGDAGGVGRRAAFSVTAVVANGTPLRR
jgi:predicted pyridoxine 5'-phosphate oxidase superfamily flavin-nucleotide-binding protein